MQQQVRRNRFRILVKVSLLPAAVSLVLHIFPLEVVSTASASAPPRINSGGIANAATFQAGPAAPGMLISIFGQNLAPGSASVTSFPLPEELNQTRVLVNNVPARLIFVSPLQINAQVPFEVAAGITANVVVRVAGEPDSSPEPLPIEITAPGIFTIPPQGTGPGAITDASTFALVTSNAPARPGQVVAIFCGGLGRTDPPLRSGQAPTPGILHRTMEMPMVTIGGQNATVDFSGAAPCCAGLYQINAVVPNLAEGDQPVFINIGGRQSRTGVTLRVQP